MTGYIASFKQDANRAEIMNALLTTLGDRLLYLRDISRSTRSLFRNKRDDFPVTMHEADRWPSQRSRRDTLTLQRATGPLGGNTGSMFRCSGAVH